MANWILIERGFAWTERQSFFIIAKSPGDFFSWRKKEEGATFWSPGEAWMLVHKELTLTILHLLNSIQIQHMCLSQTPFLRRVQTVDWKRNLQANYPWPGWIWRTGQASCDWSTHRLPGPGLARTAREVDKPLRWASQTSQSHPTRAPIGLFIRVQMEMPAERAECGMWVPIMLVFCWEMALGGECDGGFHLFSKKAALHASE